MRSSNALSSGAGDAELRRASGRLNVKSIAAQYSWPPCSLRAEALTCRERLLRRRQRSSGMNDVVDRDRLAAGAAQAHRVPVVDDLEVGAAAAGTSGGPAAPAAVGCR